VLARAVARPHAARARPAACGGRRQRGHRRRGDVPEAAAAESEGEKVGKEEETARNLTVRPIGAEGGWKVELDGEGGGPGKMAMAATAGARFRPGLGTAGVEERWRRVGAKLRSSGREGSSEVAS